MGQRVGVALIGLGTVGSSVVEILQDVAGRDERLDGVELVGIAVRNLRKVRGISVEPGLLREDAFGLMSDPAVDVVIEAAGGIDPTFALLYRAIECGKHVVTANKALLARHGEELFALARSTGVQIRYEAAVGGGIPLLHPIRQCLGANRIHSVVGIINGTTNYILTQMAIRQLGYQAALDEAQALGYAEADPSADVEGNDAQEKIAILASLAYRTAIPRLDRVYREGIAAIRLQDVRYAQELGFAIKLLAFANRLPEGCLDLRVHPTLVPVDHPLSRVDGSYNAVVITGEPVGSIMFFGRGAGGGPTASAVVSDLINICATIGQAAYRMQAQTVSGFLGIDEVSTRFYIRLSALDQLGVIGVLGHIFGEHGVSLESIVQKNPQGEAAELVIITHDVREKNLRAALAQIQSSGVLKEFCTAIRVLPETPV